jgi:predicted small lipoprotein YifL
MKMTKLNKLLALLLALVMVFALAACGGQQAAPAEEPAAEEPAAEEPAAEEPAGITAVESPEYASMKLAGLEYGTDYVSLYEQVGKSITIADVIEDPDTGLAYIEVDGEQHELGLDFLTMAMVYNTEPAGDYATADDVYAAWWRLYITRWNMLLPEVPLYSNEYYDLYNAQIKGVEEHPTNPFWDPASALIDWTSEKEDNSIILGSSTELSGQFRYATFGKTNPGSSDLDVENLTVGLETVSTTKEGGYEWNPTVVEEHSEEVDEEGNKTITIKIFDDMKLSDGTPITAKNYVVFTAASLTPVWTQAAGKETNGRTIVGWKDAYQLYDGTEGSGTPALAGLRLIDDYTFSVTIPADQLPYFYDITYGAFSAQPIDLFLGGSDLADDGEGVYITGDFYAKDGDTYAQATVIKDNFTQTTEAAYAAFPYSGPYCVKSFDSATAEAVLEINPNFKGNYEGAVPHIEKVIYKKVVTDTQLEDFKAGGLDVIAAITGGAATDEALALADGSDGKYVYTHYSRAGYGKLGFRADYGPAQFQSVRQAIAFCMDRAQFAKDFTGGYGGVVDGPYYTGSWMYKAAVAQGMMLDSYATSADSAIEVLEADGWVYDAEGNPYTSGVRYKAIPADVISENDKNYQSVDGTYKTVDMGDFFLMPLVINWYGTTPNEFTDLLQTGLKENPNVAAAGMVVYNTLGDFAPMLDELYQQAVYGFYAGSPMYCAFNFATGFNSAAYDYSWNMTIDPAMYDDYSAYYIKDYADIYWLA